ncbi:flagellar motor switch protein FliN [Alcaligenes faecalis]|uniref:flagellar motor switch protein FliN n=1 Tax=Alcaligenes faecalis TaxID=511 RepID=UPI001C9AF686|nr:flagellar motor switch protein FliN [Alcaligenes faecalis]MBY6311317.1 flagellar motor switch protein FliN [Alcaligenes faecalis]MBY6315510.1 flagellar motor switch protein FliN [Alcaligenes faecalis]MBY6393171.1 flagellar motor switch protein FliN [Alcaligenes faecalis]
MSDPHNPNDRSAPEDDWAAAMAEQQAGSQGSTQAQGLEQPLEDDWASALAEQSAAAPVHEPSPASNLFPPMEHAQANATTDIDMIMDIPVQLSVELGRTRLTIKNILQLGQGSVVELDGLAGEPLDIYVNGYLIAQGEVVVVDDKYGIRVTDIVTPSDRIQRLNGRR